MPGAETRFAVLLFTDIVGSTELKARHGVPAYSGALKTHNDHFERTARECRGIRILQNMGDGYFAEVGGVAEAVKFALLFQQAMRDGPWGEIVLTTRVGIHVGEITAFEIEAGSGIVAPAADLAARVMSLAVGGQILLTRFPFDEARHFLREHPPVAAKTMPPLGWLAHGPYLLKGRDEPMEIFEVGAEGFAPLAAPPDSEKAKRAIRPGEEETLGWRPAVGLEIPGRTGWHLTERLGADGFGEVWVSEHDKLQRRRAFKFCFDDERLRALKREVTLTRLLRSALGERDDIVRIHELKLDAPPFYLESDLAPHGNLLQWAGKEGGLDKIPPPDASRSSRTRPPPSPPRTASASCTRTSNRRTSLSSTGPAASRARVSSISASAPSPTPPCSESSASPAPASPARPSSTARAPRRTARPNTSLENPTPSRATSTVLACCSTNSSPPGHATRLRHWMARASWNTERARAYLPFLTPSPSTELGPHC